MRPLLAIIYPAALLLSAGAVAAPEFAPSPRQAFEGFVAINPPRPEVPIGALWINGYGPTGEGAAPNNLETVRSVSALMIDKGFQLALSVGLLDLLGIDPKARDRYTARFTDLSIVRVKDVGRLSGPKGEPRIIEALKAASVTVSSDSELGLNGQSLGWQSPVRGSTTNGRTKSYSIEARDMFIAVRVATPEITRSKDFLLVFAREHCAPAPAACVPRAGVAKLNTQTVPAVDTSELGANMQASLKLPVPISDENGGLFDTLIVRWVSPCGERKMEGCRGEPRVLARYEGTHLKDAAAVDAKRW